MSSIWARCGRFSETLLNLFQAADRDRKQARRPGHACRSRLPERAGAAPHGGLLPPAARGGPQPRCGGGRVKGPSTTRMGSAAQPTPAPAGMVQPLRCPPTMKRAGAEPPQRPGGHLSGAPASRICALIRHRHRQPGAGSGRRQAAAPPAGCRCVDGHAASPGGSCHLSRTRHETFSALWLNGGCSTGMSSSSPHRRAWLDIGPMREWKGHQNNVRARQHPAATIGSPSEKLEKSGSSAGSSTA